MSTPLNRKSRRAAEKRNKAKQGGLKGLSLLTTAGLISTGVSAFTGVGAFATPLPTAGCATTKPLSINVSGDAAADASAISTLNTELANFVDGTGGVFGCATVTFQGPGGTLNFTNNSIVVPAGAANKEVFFYGNNTSLEKDGTGSIIEANQDLYLEDFTDITGTDGSPAIKSLSGKSVEVSYVTLSANESRTPGAAISATGPVTAVDSIFELNISQEGGGAIYSSQGGMFISGSSFSGNKTSPLIVSGMSDTIDPASNPGHGGAIYSGGGEVRIFKGSFTDNESQGGDGGAVYAVDRVTVTGVLGLEPTPDSPAHFARNKAKNFVSLYDYYEYDDFLSDVTTPYGGSGGAIYSEASVLLEEATSFSTNEASVSGGAIYSTTFFDADGISDGEGDPFNLDNLPAHLFTSNTSSVHGGAVWAGGETYVVGGVFTSNQTMGRGGALYGAASNNLVYSPTRVSFSRFEDNYAKEGGGALYSATDVVSINSAFYRNDAGYHRTDVDLRAGLASGGAIHALGNVGTFDASVFLYGLPPLPAEIGIAHPSIFQGNRANESGGAVYSLGTQAPESEGAPFSFIAATDFTSNSSPTGGAIRTENGLQVAVSEFTNNEASNVPFVSEEGIGPADGPIPTLGGAIASFGHLEVGGSSFTGNVAQLGEGGAIYSASAVELGVSELDVAASLFTGNQAIADEGGSIGGFGGAIKSDADVVSISGSTFDSNVADRNGGAFFTSGRSISTTNVTAPNNLSVVNSTFYKNEAETGAALWLGVFEDSNSEASIVFNTFLDNVRLAPISLLSTNENKSVVHLEGPGLTFAANLLADSITDDTIGLVSYEGYGQPGQFIEVLEYNISTAPETDLPLDEGFIGNNFSASWSSIDMTNTLVSEEEGSPAFYLELGQGEVASSSIAIDVVPVGGAYLPLLDDGEGSLLDQIGTLRFQRYDDSVGVYDVGAFEFIGSDEGGPPNNAPAFTSGTTGSGTAGVPGTAYDANASDGDGDTLTYSLNPAVTGFSINSSTGVVTFDGTRPAGNYVLNIEVSDGTDTDSISVTITIAPEEEPGDDTAPVLTATPEYDSTTQTTAVASFRSNENGGAFYLVRLASQPAPDLAALLGSEFTVGVIAGVDYSIDLDGLTPGTNYIFYVVAADDFENASNILEIPFRTASADVPGPNPPANSAPVFTGGSTGSGVSGTASTVYQASAVDSDGQAVSFALVSAVNSSSSNVTGFSIESATGRVNMAANVPAGTYTLVIRATDGTSTTSRTVVITVSGSSSVVVGSSAKLVVPGFALDSAKLTLKMKKAIRKLVRANPELTTVTCRGFTSLPASARDMKLARQRGKAVCDYILKLNPNLTVKVLKGGHTEKTGSENRRVRIVMR